MNSLKHWLKIIMQVVFTIVIVIFGLTVAVIAFPIKMIADILYADKTVPNKYDEK